MYNMELNDLRIIICLRIFEVTVERFSACYVKEKLMEHGIHCLPYPLQNEVIDLLPYDGIDFRVVSSGCHSVKVLRTAVG